MQLSLIDEVRSTPDLDFESKLAGQGLKCVAGVDEAGRGPLAGPVVAAAVILDAGSLPQGINDSKQLSEKRRNELFSEIIESAAAVSWHSFNAAAIDRLNILEASMLAMERAVSGLCHTPDHVLVDGNRIPSGLAGRATALVKGDSRSLSIAAASIVAKVLRDRMMKQACETYPGYGFSGHKGYGSASHREAIGLLGPCPMHRLTFSPMCGTK